MWRERTDERRQMKIEQAQLEGVLIIHPEVFEDYRGEYVMLHSEKLFPDYHFVEDDISVSYKNVLRGIHGDNQTAKLISCLYGRLYLVVVNWDKDSPQCGEWQAFTLSDKNRLQILVPPKFGNGHLVLSDVAIFHYKQTQYYNKEGQFTIPWRHASWPIENPILSERDKNVS